MVLLKVTQENHTALLNSLLRHSSINCQVLKLHEDINLLLSLKSLDAVEILEVKLRDSIIFKTVVCRMGIGGITLHVLFLFFSDLSAKNL